MTKVLMVDNDSILLEIARAHLESTYDLEIDSTSSPVLALEMLRGGGYDVVVTDHKPPSIDAIDLLERVRNEELETAFILFTRKTDESLVMDAFARGADFYLNKTNGTRADYAQLTNMITKACCTVKTQEALAHNVKRFRFLLENANDLIFVVNADNKIQFVSPGSERLIGHQPSELLGKSVSDLFHVRNGRIESIKDLLLEGAVGAKHKHEFRVKHKNGSWVEMEGITSVFGDKSDPPQIVINVWDVTALKTSESLANRAASVLRTIANVHRAILRKSSFDELAQTVCSSLVEGGCYDVVWMAICDGDGGIASVVESGLGSETEALTEAFERGEPVECCRKALAEGGVSEVKEIFFCGECPLSRGKCGKGAMYARLDYGGHIYGTITIIPLQEYAGIAEEPTSFQTIVEDIAFAMHSAQMRETLRRSEEKYKAIFERTGATMAIIEDDTRFSMVNEEFAKLLGLPREEIEGKRSWTEFALEEELSRLQEYHRARRIDPDSVPRSYECHLMTKGGIVRDIWVTVQMIPDSRQSVVSVHDITEYNRTRSLLRKQLDENRLLLSNIQSGIERIGSPLIRMRSR